MPRRERPLDPNDGVVSQFAAGLRRVRERAGSPTYRELGRRAHYSAAALSEAAGGPPVLTKPTKRCPGITEGRSHRCGAHVQSVSDLCWGSTFICPNQYLSLFFAVQLVEPVQKQKSLLEVIEIRVRCDERAAGQVGIPQGLLVASSCQVTRFAVSNLSAPCQRIIECFPHRWKRSESPAHSQRRHVPTNPRL